MATLDATGPLARRHRVTLSGEGAEPFVLAHGLGTDQSVWHRLRASLEPHFLVVSFDLAGAGPWLPPDFDPAAYQDLGVFADDLLDLLDEIGLSACPWYLGHSVSGAVGLLAAAADPQRFGHLFLLNASARYLNDTDYVGGFLPADLEGLYAAMRHNYEGWVAGFSQWVVDARMPEAVAEFSQGFLAMRPDITVAMARVIFESDIRQVVPHVSTPVTLIHNRDDPAVPPEAAQWLQRHLPLAELDWIDAVGHLPHLTAAPALREVLAKRLGVVLAPTAVGVA